MRFSITFWLVLSSVATAAVPNRIQRPVDLNRVHGVGGVHRLAQPSADQGALEATRKLDYVALMVKLSPQQQTDLNQLLADQQNPSSPQFRKWLTPEEFGSRFGLSPADHSKIVAWLESQGLRVQESARARNWIAFTGTAGQISKALRTSIHRYQVEGRMHFANSTEPSVPEAFADVIDGFLGLDDFLPTPDMVPVPVDYNSGGQHYIVPEDFATIYNLNPLYQAGLDGTGQSIAVVGQSNVLLSDLRAFRSRYGLPANDPRMVPYTGVEPGFTGSQLEGNLDLEWAGAIAPKATIYYVYGTNAFTAFISAVNANLAPIVSISYGGCETDYRLSFYRAVAQQASAQGITVLASSGDAGPTGCDRQGTLIASRGRVAHFPTVIPEITSVGGTQFVEGSGNYWASTNTATFGSALSYIPEAAWNETSGTMGILAGGGGVSSFYPQPAWQKGQGVPNDGFRHYPDVSLTAAIHDGYYVTYQGSIGAVGGTSASTPALAGIVALLNQYQVTKGFQPQPGVGNINPQLYRLAQSAPSAFHDVIAGHIGVPCSQGSPQCLAGSISYEAAPGYDMATGLGSIDAATLINQWNSAARGVNVNLIVSATRVTVNDTVAVTAQVAGVNGTPTGNVDFSINGIPLGSSPLVARAGQGQVADLFFPAYLAGTGTFALSATYSGDAAFSTGGSTRVLTVIAGTGAAGIVVTAPNTVWPAYPDAQGLTWQTVIVLRDVANVASIVTGFRIDGTDQPLARYFPSPNIPSGGSVTVDLVFKNLTPPLVRTFEFTGVDSGGRTWTRQVSVNYFPMPSGGPPNLTAMPLTVTRNTGDPCEWPVQISVDDLGGSASQLTGLFAGGVSLTSQIAAIFGTTRLAPWGSLQGTICLNGGNFSATQFVEVDFSSGFARETFISFAERPVLPGKLSAAPASLSLSAASPIQPTQATVKLDMPDKSQPWTISVLPGNRTAGWLTVSPLSGIGPAEISLTASGAGFAPGAYRASLVIQSPDAVPQTLRVPVMFVLGGSTSGTVIDTVSNAASGKGNAAPGMVLSIYGKKLANTTRQASGSPMPYTLDGVSAVVNGVAAPILYVSANQVNIQVPFEVGAGPGVLGINNNGEIAGIALTIAPSAPGIFTGSDGKLIPQPTISIGKTATLYLSGAGELSPAITTAFAVSPQTSLAASPKPVLPLSLMVGGVPAFVQAFGLAPGLVGPVQVNFLVPASVAPGPQPVVVTVGGVASAPLIVDVQP